MRATSAASAALHENQSKSAIKWGMKPIGIFRAAPTEGPGYFATYLERRSFEWKLIALDQGEAVPRDPRAYSGLALMGGPMSVNDELPWIAPLLELLRNAVRQDVPVIGHCLGGQLMSRAFGGAVRSNPVREIGWGEVRVADNGVAREWLGELPSFQTFQWHGETFSIPPGATRVLEGEHCANQAFALGRHLAMQCHVEMTPELVRTWLSTGTQEIREHKKSPAVQPPEEIQKDLDHRLERLHQVADRIYDRWSEGLNRGS
jgi:GMP synthase-like glutamine amidotransferase